MPGAYASCAACPGSAGRPRKYAQAESLCGARRICAAANATSRANTSAMSLRARDAALRACSRGAAALAPCGPAGAVELP